MRAKFVTALASAALLAVLWSGAAFAIRPDEILADRNLEKRARLIGAELRCLVCQNESIDDSNADLAHDLRVLVRQRLVAGDTDEQVKQYIVARYGNYVLLKPPFTSETYLLWFGPLLLLLSAAGVAAIYLRRRASVPQSAPLTDDESRRLSALLDDGERKKED